MRRLAVTLMSAALLATCSAAGPAKGLSGKDPKPQDRTRMVFQSILYCLHQTSGDHRPWLYSVTPSDVGNLNALSELLTAQGFTRVDPSWVKADTAHKQFYYAEVEGWNPTVHGRTSIRIYDLYDNNRSEILHESYATIVFKHSESGWRLDRPACTIKVGE